MIDVDGLAIGDTIPTTSIGGSIIGAIVPWLETPFWPPMLVVQSSETLLQRRSESVCICIGYFALHSWDIWGSMDTSFEDWTKVSRKQKLIHEENRRHGFAWNATANDRVYWHSIQNRSIAFKLHESLLNPTNSLSIWNKRGLFLDESFLLACNYTFGSHKLWVAIMFSAFPWIEK